MSKSSVLPIGSRSPSPARHGKKRKRSDSTAKEIEVDINAPEPPSKKALRKAKRAKTASVATKTKESGGTSASVANELPDVSLTKAAGKAKKGRTSPPIIRCNESEAAGPASNSRSEKLQSLKRAEFGVWIGNLSWTATKDDVRKFITTDTGITQSQITRINIPTPKNSKEPGTRKNKGFAYVDLTTKEALAEALSLSEALMGGRRLLIKDAKSFEGRPEKNKEEATPAVPSGKPPSKRIFVGNLGFDTTKEDLQDHFLQCGEVLDLHIATFEDSGKCKGYAWVDFDTIEAGHAAVRGWVNIEQKPEDNDEMESSGEQDGVDLSVKNKKKRKTRKWWVNKLHGRPLRMEFAEYKAARYKKRFGKNTSLQTKTIDDPHTENSVGDTAITDTPAVVMNATNTRRSEEEDVSPRHPKKRFDARTVRSVAALAAAPRLEGSIIAGQGKKTVLA
ncbi:MAG: hypothetical protein Q9191_002311 [Dirinaria sp. TL-2023a]